MRAWNRLPAAVFLAVVCGSATSAEVAAPSVVDSVVDSKFELFVHDVSESQDFYAALGFSVAKAKAKAEGYSTLTSGSTVIALSPLPWWVPVHWVGFLRHPPIGTEIVLYSADLETSKAMLEDRGYSPGETRLQPWGHRDFRITDPDGYCIRVSEGAAVPSEP